MSAKEEFRGRYVAVSFDGAENNALWFMDPATEESTRIMLDEMPEFVEYLKYWMPGLFDSRATGIYSVVESGDSMTHRLGDRIAYYRDAALTGVVAEVAPQVTSNAVYGVRWDDDPERVAHWYTYSMLTPHVKVDVCREDGTVHDARFFCPTCNLRGDE